MKEPVRIIALVVCLTLTASTAALSQKADGEPQGSNNSNTSTGSSNDSYSTGPGGSYTGSGDSTTSRSSGDGGTNGH